MGFKSSNKGVYKCKNPSKYAGNVNNIIFRSSWELSTNKFLDGNPNIIKWSSEPFGIPYVKTSTQKIHKYYPDYYVQYKNKQGKILTEIWEVKPKKQLKKPRVQKNSKLYIRELLTYQTNLDKWASATKFCNKYNIKFRLISELDLFA